LHLLDPVRDSIGATPFVLALDQSGSDQLANRTAKFKMPAVVSSWIEFEYPAEFVPRRRALVPNQKENGGTVAF
jgi:hypothetical protein